MIYTNNHVLLEENETLLIKKVLLSILREFIVSPHLFTQGFFHVRKY